MRVDLFDFDLPDENIAIRPADPRDTARMLRIEDGKELENLHVFDLPLLLRAGDALVFNDTKVLPAQLHGKRVRGEASAAIDATLHMRVAVNRWKAFMRPAKRLAVGDLVDFSSAENPDALTALVVEKGDAGEFLLEFSQSGPLLDQALHLVGHIPLPPYIASKRKEDARDRTDYQTIYANEEGAVAAPTAGLHFTPDLMERLDQAGISRHFVTLHVGAGTFLPVKVDDTNDHKMHEEIGQVSAEIAQSLNEVHARGGRIIAVGTTSLRLLESATGEDGVIRPFHGSTDIFITPGYKFRAVDILMTNFHLPRSTLFMLVSAFAGSATMRSAYEYAIENGYRFYSYGDSSLLFRGDT